MQADAEALLVWPEMAQLPEAGQMRSLRCGGNIKRRVALKRCRAALNARFIDTLQQQRSSTRRLGEGKRGPGGAHQAHQQEALQQCAACAECHAEYAFEALQLSSYRLVAEVSFSHHRNNSTLAPKEKAERGVVNPPIIVRRAKAVALAACIASAILICAAPQVSADSLSAGAEAYSAGEFSAAAESWRPSAEAGDALAQFNLALLHDSAASGMFDSARAADWYRRAARQGFAAAQFNLAVAYQMGRGVGKDMTAALFWLLVASQAEDSAIGARAIEAARQFAAVMSEEAGAEAAARAKQWRAEPESQVSSVGEQDRTPYMTLSDSDVMLLQQRLKALGYDPGPIDGIAGEATQRAIAAFFEDSGREWRHGPLSHQRLEILR